MKRIPLFFLAGFISTSLFTSTLLAGTAQASSIPAIPEILGRMQSALQNLNYYGTLVYLHDGQVQSMRIVHKYDDAGEQERLINLTGAGREVVRNNDVVTCFIPDRKVVTVGKRKPQKDLISRIMENDYSLMQEHYDFTVEVNGRVAGLDTYKVSILPKDAYRYGYILWLAEDNFLLLRSDLVSEDGTVLEQSMFADVQIVNHIPSDMLQPVTDGSNFKWFKERTDSMQPQSIDSQWELTDVPYGFNVTGIYHHPLPETTTPAEHWVLSDGLASVSIYIEQTSEDKDAFSGASSMGVMNVYGALASGHQITVIGDVPATTVKSIAESVSVKTIH